MIDHEMYWKELKETLRRLKEGAIVEMYLRNGNKCVCRVVRDLADDLILLMENIEEADNGLGK